MNASDFEVGAGVVPGRLVRIESARPELLSPVEREGLVAFVPDPLPPRLDWMALSGRLLPRLLSAQTALARLDGLASRVPNPGALLRQLWTREAVMSSRIENIDTTVEAVAMSEASASSVDAQAHEARNYVRALEHGVGSELALSRRLFCEMHALLLEGVRGSDRHPGHFRESQVFIGSSGRGIASARFVPPPPGDHLDACLEEFEGSLRGPPGEVPALAWIAMCHYQFECIHPFRDGNGRLGRLMSALQMVRAGLVSRAWAPVSGYFEAHRREYYDLLLGVSTRGAWEAWIGYFLDAVAAEAEGAQRRADRLGALRERYRAMVTGPRTGSMLLRLVDELFVRPAVTIPGVVSLMGVTYKPAQGYVNSLVELGILERAGEGNYAKTYVARGIIEAIEA